MKHYLVIIRQTLPFAIDAFEMNGRELELDDFYKVINGFIEVIPIPSMPDLKLVIDDCGIMKNLPLNIFATELANHTLLFDALVGPALIAKQKGPELWPLDESDLSKLHEYAKSRGCYVERH